MLYSSLQLIMRVASILVINFELVQLQQDLSLLFFHLDYLSQGQLKLAHTIARQCNIIDSFRDVWLADNERLLIPWKYNP